MVNLSGDEGCPGADPDGGGDLSADLDVGGEQETDRSQLPGAASIVLSAPAGAESERAASCALQYGGESKSGLQPMGSAANWRCVALEKLSRVKLVEDAWRTAPNHSRPASCVVEADIDAEDHSERDPQKGH